MNGNFQLNQDNLILKIKNMPKPPISKQIVRKIGFNPKKFETIIDKLLIEISEVRNQRIKENYFFEEKIKSIQNSIGNNEYINTKLNKIKNKINKNSKSNKTFIIRPKSNYNSIKSSGYGIRPKKINITSARTKKKTNAIRKNNIPLQKIALKRNKILTYNNKNYHSTNKIIYNRSNINNSKNQNINNKKNINSLILTKNNSNNLFNFKNKNKPSFLVYQELMNKKDKIQKENKTIEKKYQNNDNKLIFSPKSNIINNQIEKVNIKDKEKINNQKLFQNNSDLIKKNIHLISKDIIDELLYELIIDLKKIEDIKEQKKKLEKENKIKEILNLDKKKCQIKERPKKNLKFIAQPKKDLINKCFDSKNNFKKFMKFKGSFFIKDIFKIYDEFVEEISKSVVEEELDYYINHINDFIEKIEK